MTIFNGVSIADPSGDNRKDSTNQNYEEALKDNQLPHETDGDQNIENNNPDTYPSSKGFVVDETVTVPITQPKNLEYEYERRYEDEQDLNADVEIFSQSSTLSNADAKDFVSEAHYGTMIITDWKDPETGRVVLREEKPRKPTRLM